MTLDPRAKALLEAARPGFDPSTDACARVEAGLLAALGVAATGAGAGAAGTVAAKGGAAALKLAAGGLTGKLVLGVSAAIAVGIGAAALRPSRVDAPLVYAPSSDARQMSARPHVAAPPTAQPAQPRNAASARPPPADAPTLPVAPHASSSSSSPAHPRSVGRASTPASDSAPEPASDLAAELALVRGGAARLAAGDGAGALASFDTHARDFPRGALAEERAAGRVRALCLLGRVDEARVEGERLLAADPASPYAAVVRASCAGRR